MDSFRVACDGRHAEGTGPRALEQSDTSNARDEGATSLLGLVSPSSDIRTTGPDAVAVESPSQPVVNLDADQLAVECLTSRDNLHEPNCDNLHGPAFPVAVDDSTVDAIAFQTDPVDSVSWIETYGTITCGAELMRLAWRRDLSVDVVMAYQTFAGFRVGRWFHRVRRNHGLGSDWQQSPTGMFAHPNGSCWTSEYYRRTYLWPALEQQRRDGDPFLSAFDGSPGNSIPEKFWSLHTYRRGARSHVSKTCKG